jgi:hypothetical protein
MDDWNREGQDFHVAHCLVYTVADTLE